MTSIEIAGYRQVGTMLVDDADAGLFAGLSLSIFGRRLRGGRVGTRYARVYVAQKIAMRGRGGAIYRPAHQFVLPPRPGLEVDHANGNGLDNRRSNLRYATRQQNAVNCVRKGRSSKFKGVCWDRSRRKWTAGIKKDYRRINLGRFDSEEAAARAFDAKARELFGEFARLNFPDGPR